MELRYVCKGEASNIVFLVYRAYSVMPRAKKK